MCETSAILSKLKGAFETAILAGVSVRRVEDITEALWGTKVSLGPEYSLILNSTIYKTIFFTLFHITI